MGRDLSTVEARAEHSAACDVLVRAKHIRIARDTPTSEIVSEVEMALGRGGCAKLGRLAVAVHEREGSIRYLASDEESARSDPDRWRDTARVRRTWSLAEPEIRNKLAAALVAAWMSDWNLKAPDLKLDQETTS
jgi:hypothetical protein